MPKEQCVAGHRPLFALLSHPFVAFTIEVDNEFERRMPHRTTVGGGVPGAPFLVSSVMWWNCMHFLTDEGVRKDDLITLARTKTNLDGMRGWGYIKLQPDSVIRATANGRAAGAIWQPLFSEATPTAAK
jgi:hypothetical protein